MILRENMVNSEFPFLCPVSGVYKFMSHEYSNKLYIYIYIYIGRKSLKFIILSCFVFL